MARKYDLAEEVKAHRYAEELSQDEFWRRLGVTQSGGSRYENARVVPLSTAILAYLYLEGSIDDTDLLEAKKVLGRT